MPFIGVYDAFSASVAARHFDGLFVSGFGFAASYYGLPDIGFIAWPDILAFVQRLRSILPAQHLLVDIDDGYCDTEIACHVVSALDSLGVKKCTALMNDNLAGKSAAAARLHLNGRPATNGFGEMLDARAGAL